jgi:hypothetical protein
MYSIDWRKSQHFCNLATWQKKGESCLQGMLRLTVTFHLNVRISGPWTGRNCRCRRHCGSAGDRTGPRVPGPQRKLFQSSPNATVTWVICDYNNILLNGLDVDHGVMTAKVLGVGTGSRPARLLQMSDWMFAMLCPAATCICTRPAPPCSMKRTDARTLTHTHTH